MNYTKLQQLLQIMKSTPGAQLDMLPRSPKETGTRMWSVLICDQEGKETLADCSFKSEHYAELIIETLIKQMEKQCYNLN
jgi:hypothetical protein